MTPVVMLALVLPWLNPFAPGPAPPTVQGLVGVTGIAVVLLALVRPMDATGFAKVAAAMWLGAALASCAIGMLQYFGVSAYWAPWVNQTGAGEAFANLRQRNQFASLTNIGLVALLWWVFWRGESSGAARPAQGSRVVEALHWKTAWPMAAAAVLAAGNASSSSRTGMVQLALVAVMSIAWGWLRRGEMRRLLLVAAVTYSVAAFALPWMAGLDRSATGILARLHDAGPACASRLTLWANVLHLIAQKPWLGWGWGELDYAHFITLYPGQRFCDILDNAHNLPLHLAVELGTPVAVMLCGLGVWLVCRARPWSETNPPRQVAWAVLALILLHSLLEYPLWYGPFQMAVGLCIWLLWRTRRANGMFAENGNNPSLLPVAGAQPPFASVLLVTCAVLLLAGVAYAGWDYRRVSQIYRATELRAPEYRENTLEKIRGSWLFRNQVRFAEFSITNLTLDNAEQVYALGRDLLHFSPEARVVEKLVESAVMLGRDDEAQYYVARYEAAFPAQHAQWHKSKALPPGLPQFRQP